MENKNEKDVFSYTYSAKQQEEVKRIRDKYAPQSTDKMEQLRRLDKSVTQKGTMWSLVIGIIGTLLMGIGMCCALEWQGVLMIPGIIVGVIGIALVSLAYPIYQSIIKKERARIAPEILRLTDELMK